MSRELGAPRPGSTVRFWPGMRTEYAWLAPHDDPTVTRPGQIGVAFTAHRGLVYESGGRTVEADHPPGAAVVSGAAPVTWLRVGEHTEALEIYPDPHLLATVAAARSPRPTAVAPAIGCPDGTVLAVGSTLRRAHSTGLTDVAASSLAHRLVDHLLDRYAGLRDPDRGARSGRLQTGAVDRVTDLVEARLDQVLTLDDLAAAVRLSPYHFHRSFRASTGMAPHAFVTARRMDRARLLLWTSGRTVDEVATDVGFRNLSHFRRVFRRHHGLPPSAFRPLAVGV
jgi:AraC family transcriptional regulator